MYENDSFVGERRKLHAQQNCLIGDEMRFMSDSTDRLDSLCEKVESGRHFFSFSYAESTAFLFNLITERRGWSKKKMLILRSCGFNGVEVKLARNFFCFLKISKVEIEFKFFTHFYLTHSVCLFVCWFQSIATLSSWKKNFLPRNTKC